MDTEAIVDDPLAARLFQVAGVLDLPSGDVLEVVRRMGSSCDSAEDWLEKEVLDQVLKDVPPRKAPSTLRPTILQAFAAARSKKSDWRTMALPVLKNRLLQLTDGAFDETDYGWPNLRFLAEAFPGLLEYNPTHIHGAVSLIDVSSLEEAEGVTGPTAPTADRAKAPSQRIAHAPSTRRIRPDLWDAVVDYASGATYVWDESTGAAAKSVADDPRRPFPTIGPGDVLRWRTAAAEEWIGQHSDDADVVRQWVENPRTEVSSGLRTAWNNFQKKAVAEILESFFRVNDLVAPDGIYVDRPALERTDVVSARSVARRAIEVMSEQELMALQLPVHAVLRILEELRNDG